MNYHISSTRISYAKMPSKSCASVKGLFHPLSYYLNGGIDLRGDALDKSAEVEFDNDDQLAELEIAGAMSVPYGDPRESKMSLIERYNSLGESMSASAPVNAVKTEPVEGATSTSTE